MSNSFHTIIAPTEGLYKEKGSKFIAFAHPVSNENEVKIIQDGLKKQFFDARHHCYAYILAGNHEKTRTYDDGEPNHTAGTPILNQIRSLGLQNVSVFVVRYFGGTKLGVSGLISAYKDAAADALSKAELLEVFPSTSIRIQCDYADLNEAMKMVKQFELKLLNMESSNYCVLDISCKDEILDLVKNKITDLEIIGIRLILEIDL